MFPQARAPRGAVACACASCMRVARVHVDVHLKPRAWATDAGLHAAARVLICHPAKPASSRNRSWHVLTARARATMPEQVLVTPHTAFLTREALDAIATATIGNLEEVRASRPAASAISDRRAPWPAMLGANRMGLPACGSAGCAECCPCRAAHNASSLHCPHPQYALGRPLTNEVRPPPPPSPALVMTPTASVEPRPPPCPPPAVDLVAGC